MNKEELIIAAASKVHEDWCIEELSAFFKRAQEHKNNGLSVLEALIKACYKGEKLRNEVTIDRKLVEKNSNEFNACLDDFDNFMNLLNSKIINVKRFTGRTLTDEEQIKAGDNYKLETSEENILREFTSLSAESKKENLDAAIGAFNIYVEFSKAGITIEQMEKDQKLKNLIGLAIHTDWLRRNKNHYNDSLKVPYNDLDESTQAQDLTVFSALLKIVKQNIDKYKVNAEPGYILPNYELEEQKILNEINKTKTKK